MIWFVIAVVLIAAGAVMIWLSRARAVAPPLPRQGQRENLFEPPPSSDRRG